MQFLVIFLVYALAVGNAEECNEERAEACVESLLSSILGDTTEEEVCKELRTSINCLRNAVDECISQEDKDDEVEEGLQELEKVLKDNCQESESDNEISDEEDAQIQQCFEENEDYIYECIYEGSSQALSLMIENNSDLDENVLQCTMYALMSACFMERIGEKCGEKAAELAEQDLSDMPPEVLEACNAAGDIQAHSFQLLDKKRK